MSTSTPRRRSTRKFAFVDMRPYRRTPKFASGDRKRVSRHQNPGFDIEKSLPSIPPHIDETENSSSDTENRSSSIPPHIDRQRNFAFDDVFASRDIEKRHSIAKNRFRRYHPISTTAPKRDPAPGIAVRRYPPHIDDSAKSACDSARALAKRKNATKPRAAGTSSPRPSRAVRMRVRRRIRSHDFSIHKLSPSRFEAAPEARRRIAGGRSEATPPEHRTTDQPPRRGGGGAPQPYRHNRLRPSGA